MSAAPAGAFAERTLRAGSWQGLSSLVQGAAQFWVGVLLARLLAPGDFGLVALALAVTGLTRLAADLGLGPAVVQRRPLTDRHLRTALGAALVLGALAAALLVLLAPLLGRLLRAPELPGLLRLAALGFVLSALGGTSRALLRRRLDFRRIFRVDAASYLLGYALVATVLAFAGAGAWSLVWGALAQGAIGTVLGIRAARPPLVPLLARAELRELLGFGAGVSLNALANYAARNADNLIVGRWLGTAMLGLYSRAYNLMALPLFYVSSVTGSVLFPALSEIQHDRARIGRAYLKGVQLVTLAVAPVMAGMIVAAPHLVAGLYGPRWTGAALPLQLLCAFGLFRSVYDAAAAVTHASGRVYAELARQALYALMVVAGCVAGMRWGIAGVAAGVGAAVLFMYLAMAQLALRITGCGWRAFAAAQVPGVCVAAGVGAAALLARVALEGAGAGSLVAFGGILAACALAFPAALWLLPERARPAELFGRLEGVAAALPLRVRPALLRMAGAPRGEAA